MKQAFTLVTVTMTPDDTSENYVWTDSSHFKQLTEHFASAYRVCPWKGRVVLVRGDKGAVYRLLRGNGGLSIESRECWFGTKTRNQLSIDVGGKLTIEPVWQPWGRCCYYWNHIDDTVRLAARIGIAGLIFAVFAIGLGLLSIGLSIFQIWLALR
jgi:hypothetical protein